MYSNEPVTSLLNRWRLRLDQETDIQTNFWSDAEGIEYMNEGAREVWEITRRQHQNWFIKRLTSRDGVVKVGGKDYDTSNLKMISGRTTLLLPPDFMELKLFEGMRPLSLASEDLSNPFFPQVELEYMNITQLGFRNRIVDTVTQGIRRYRYDVLFGPDGPYIYIVPTISVVETVDVQIAYIAGPTNLSSQMSFEGTGFTNLMIDAVLAYMCLAAARKEDVVENIATFEKQWMTKQTLCADTAGPKQSRDVETVENSYSYQEDEL